MEFRLGRIEDKLDKLADIQAVMQANLQEHMKRTEIAESNISELASRMAPVQEHVALTNALGKIIIGITAIVGAIAAIWQLFVR